MPEGSTRNMPPPAREMSGKAAIIGIGETDYHEDYKAERAKAPGYEPPTAEGLVQTAFARALADSGLKHSDIDGLSASFTYGGPPLPELAGMLGIKPDFMIENGNIMAGPLPVVCAAIASGKCNTVAMVYAVASRSIGRQYGGATYTGGSEAMPSSYYYYHPWGWSSQAAHWAMIFRYYQETYGVTEADLGAVALQLRKNASACPNAVMQTPLTIAQYLASRYIVKPLHLFDMCLVNDGAVCLIVRRADMARDLPHVPVGIAGWGEAKQSGDKFHALVRERLRPVMQEAGGQALAMAGKTLADIGHFEGYDAASIHLINQVEGYGFTPPGTGLAFCQEGQMAHTGRLPVNTEGGNMSGSYMHGWSQIAEIVRQLRHEAGALQVPGVQCSMFSLAQTDQAHPLIFTRGV